MKDKNKLLKIILAIALFLILLICIMLGTIYIYQKANNLNKKQQEKIDLINSDYNKFSILTNDFNLKRENLNIYMDKDIYYKDFNLIKDEFYKFYEEYDEIIGSIKNVAESLKISCKNNYAEENINKKCNSYKEAYEMIINIYLNDIIIYNDLSNNYNSLVDSDKAKIFESIYVTEYIDVNNDGVYSGKDV